MPDLYKNATFAYIQAKAQLFLDFGAIKYSQVDCFGLPGENLPIEEIEILKAGCQQIMENHGLTLEDPFENLGIPGFHDLLRMFHFEFTGQLIVAVTNEYIFDKMIMQHVVDGRTIILFNKVRKMYLDE